MQYLIDGIGELGIRLTPSQETAFQIYYDQLVVWNQRFNLTAITEYDQVQIRHFLDSLSCLLAPEPRDILNRPNARAIDVGTGAGFPGIPLKLVCSQSHLTLLEATAKKIDFLEHLVATLQLPTVTAIHARAEDLAHQPAHRQQYDLALARAVADLSVLVEYTLPFCKVGGWLVAHKGETGAAEAWTAEHAVQLLGGELRQVVPVELPGLPEDRSLILIQKVSPTPERYPRRPGVPSKRPLNA